MSFISVRDQHGNPPPTNGRVDVQLIPDDWSGGTGPQDDRFTDDGGNTSFPGATQLWPATGYTLTANRVNVNPNYGSAERHVTAAEVEAAPITLDIVKKNNGGGGGGPINGYGSCEEAKAAVFDIFHKHGYNSPGPDNEGQGTNQAPYLRATIAEIQALYTGPNASYVQWQYESGGNPPELRPRLFLPHSGSDKFQRYADIGDWDGPLKWEHCS